MRKTYYVYFIQGESGGPIKIGKTGAVKNRVHELQVGNPNTLKILKSAMETSILTEKRLHHFFSAFRVRANGEWFHPDPYILSFIEKIKGSDLYLAKSMDEYNHNTMIDFRAALDNDLIVQDYFSDKDPPPRITFLTKSRRRQP